MVKVKTVILSGTEQEVSGLESNNALVVNNSEAPVYASNNPNVVAYEDGVIEIPVGARDTVVGTNGTVYLLGNGRVEVRGVDYVGFKMPSSSVSGGGGGKGQIGVICGEYQIIDGGIKSIPVTMTGSVEQSFAAALAAETGWELQPDGVSVLKDGEIGFRFVYREWGNYRFVCLVNNVKNGDSDYLDNFQYLQNTGASYYMDVCYSPNGAVAFGFRPENETPKLTFMMTKDGDGDLVCVATYYKDMRLEWGKKGDTSGRMIRDDPLRACGTENSILGLFKFADEYSGRTFEDCYCVYLRGATYPAPGAVVSINGNQFAVVYNHIYDAGGQVWLAMPVAEKGG